MGLETNSTLPLPPRTSASSRSSFRQRRQYPRGEATPLINSARSSQPASPGSLKNLLFQRYRTWAGIDIDGSQRPLWVDSRHLPLAHRATAVSGLLTFAGLCSNGKVA